MEFHREGFMEFYRKVSLEFYGKVSLEFYRKDAKSAKKRQSEQQFQLCHVGLNRGGCQPRLRRG